MKLAITVFLLQLLTTAALAQTDESKINFDSPHIKFIELTPPAIKIAPSLPIGAITVYDVRIDSSCLGILAGANPFTVIDMKKGIAAGVKEYYSKMMGDFHPAEDHAELVCFIRKFILSDHIIVANKNETIKPSSDEFDPGDKGGLILTLEFYAHINNQYIPLYRFDSTIQDQFSLKEAAANYVSMGLQAGFRKISVIPWDRLANQGKKLSWEEIEAFNKQRTNLPILHSPPAKGLFMTFEEFRSNKILHNDFRIETGKLGDFIYIKNESGKEVLLTEFWGYSDGVHYYIYSANNFFRLYRTGNGFKIFGARNLALKRNINLWKAAPIDLITRNSNYSRARTTPRHKLMKTCFLLDMETGQLY